MFKEVGQKLRSLIILKVLFPIPGQTLYFSLFSTSNSKPSNVKKIWADKWAFFETRYEKAITYIEMKEKGDKILTHQTPLRHS